MLNASINYGLYSIQDIMVRNKKLRNLGNNQKAVWMVTNCNFIRYHSRQAFWDQASYIRPSGAMEWAYLLLRLPYLASDEKWIRKDKISRVLVGVLGEHRKRKNRQ